MVASIPLGRWIVATGAIVLASWTFVPAAAPPESSASALEEKAIRSLAYSDRARTSLKGGDSAPPQVGGTFTVNYSTQPQTLNNVLRRRHRDSTLCREYLFPPLLYVDGNTLELSPELAEKRPEILDDGKRMIWTLRPGVLWHRGTSDGEPVEVTTADVQFSWDMIHHPEVDAQHVAAALDRFRDLKVIDRYSFEVRLEEPFFKAEHEFGWEFRLMPAHLSQKEPAAFNQDPLGREPVGYGPYRLEEWADNQHLTLVRNEQYPCRPGRDYYLERVRFVFVHDPEAAVNMFVRGDLSVCTVDNPERWDDMKQQAELQERATFHEYVLSRWNFIGWNNDHWAFSDARVRRAMTMLYPRDQVQEKFYRGYSVIPSAPLPILSREYDSSVPPLEHDPDGAGKLLQEAGFRDTDGDGILDRDGKPFRFELLTDARPIPAMDKGSLLFQQELEEAGVVMEIRRIDFNQLVERMRNHEFDAGQLGWSDSARDPDLYPVLHSAQNNGGYNFQNYRSEECDRLLVGIRSELDEERRMELSHRMHQLIHEDQPMTLLPTPLTLLLVSTDLQNVSITRRGALYHNWFFRRSAGP